MNNLCTNCHYIGDGYLNKSDSKLVEYALWGISIFFLIIGYGNTITLILSFFFIALSAAYSAFRHSKKDSYCPKCKKESMIPLDTPKAQELIKTHNLVVPEEPIETSKPKAPWQTN